MSISRALPRILPLAAFALGVPCLLMAAERPREIPGQSNYVIRAMAGPIQVQPATIEQLLQCLVGPGVTVTNAVLTAAPGAAGLFTGAAAVIGVDQGLVLSSGNIVTLVGPNLQDDASYDNALPGDPALDALIPGYTTFDATILEFDFTCENPSALSFQYVFASEEYNEWVGSPFNDVFAFFLNGTNIAAVPASCSSPGIPVAINNVDCGFPYVPAGGPNCDCYRNNALPDGGGLINTEMDGLTQVFYATAQLQPGTNHIKLAVADAGDHILDSNVMISCQSFVCGTPPTTGACCIEGDDCFLLGEAQCLSQGGIYKGDGTACSPNPCEPPTPSKPASWGSVKSIYR